MRRFFFLALLLFFPVTTLAQGARYNGTITNQQGLPVPAATVYVCTLGATGTPCSPTASIYSNSGLTTPMANPITTDNFGRYGFWVQPGSYLQQVSGFGITTYTQPITVGGGSVLQLGNCPVSAVAGTCSYVDVTTIPNYLLLDTGVLIEDALTICGTSQTCIIDLRGLLAGSSSSPYAWNQCVVFNRAASVFFPNAYFQMTSDNYCPMILVDRAPTITGTVNLIGMGGTAGSTYTILKSSVQNDVIADMAGDSSLRLHIDSLSPSCTAFAVLNVCTAVEADEGGSGDTPVSIENALIGSGRYGFRELGSYPVTVTNVTGAGGAMFRIENGLVAIDGVYGDTGGTSLDVSNDPVYPMFVANHDYQSGDDFNLRSNTCGYLFTVSVAGTSGSTPPDCISSGTGTSGTMTYAPVQKFIWNYWQAGGIYPQNGLLTENIVGFANPGSFPIYQCQDSGGCSNGIALPVFCFSLNCTYTDNGHTWKNIGTFSAPSYSDFGLLTVRNADFEESVYGNCMTFWNAEMSVVLDNVECSIFLHDALLTESYDPQLVWNGGYISGSGAVNGIDLQGSNGNWTIGGLYQININGVTVTSNGPGSTGYGLVLPCSSPPIYFHGSVITNWNGTTNALPANTNQINSATGCSNAAYAPALYYEPAVPTAATAQGNYVATPVLDVMNIKDTQITCPTAGSTFSPTFVDFYPNDVFSITIIQPATGTACTVSWPSSAPTVHLPSGTTFPSATLGSVNKIKFQVSANGTDAYMIDVATGMTGGTP